MATVPPGPSSALPVSPAEIPPFPGCGSVEPSGEDGGPDCHEEDGVPATPQPPPVAELARLDLSSSHGRAEEESHGIRYVRYESELQMPWIMRLITKDLSEPYSIYTYRYFIHNWPQLCFLAMVEQECVGAIVCKLDMHKKMFRRGYIAMLAVDSKHRRKSIGTNLVKKAIYAMVEGDCDEVVLETEITNKSALKLYENLGFVRDKRLFRYYLNGVDALRLKLWLR
uniref:N-alpha-acetyltransferase 30 n=1 Tax=Monopterus albus TaxID=43700 RepID=UPI0009B486DB|nr:N-alpha-acetyltransferase 30 [Monopterus albus]